MDIILHGIWNVPWYVIDSAAPFPLSKFSFVPCNRVKLGSNSTYNLTTAPPLLIPGETSRSRE
eukprot:14233525-Ditylum_brightwellii.AAC.1